MNIVTDDRVNTEIMEQTAEQAETPEQAEVSLRRSMTP